jgi:hypothetical protein
MQRRVAAALVAALALGVASCGGSESLTRAEVVNRIEAACRAAQARAEQAQRGARGGAADFLGAAIASQRVLTERVESIEASDDVADEVDALKAGLAERTQLVDEVADAPRGDQARVLAEVGRAAEAATRRVDAALDRLGVRGCS